MTGTPVDPDVFAELQEAMGADFAAELVAAFLQEAPGMLNDLGRAVSEDDPDGFRRAAHSLKSNASLFGAAALADLARGMELGGMQAAAPDRLEAEYGRVSAALRGLIDG